MLRPDFHLLPLTSSQRHALELLAEPGASIRRSGIGTLHVARGGRAGYALSEPEVSDMIELDYIGRQDASPVWYITERGKLAIE